MVSFNQAIVFSEKMKYMYKVEQFILKKSYMYIDICLFHNNFKINMVFLTCILNIGHVTSKHITYSSHEIN